MPKFDESDKFDESEFTKNHPPIVNFLRGCSELRSRTGVQRADYDIPDSKLRRYIGQLFPEQLEDLMVATESFSDQELAATIRKMILEQLEEGESFQKAA